MAKLKLGLIGCGNYGRVHACCMATIPDAEFIAYADVVDSAAKGFLKEFGGKYATQDPQKIIKDRTIDAVYICTRHDSHASLAIAAANAGKHIFIEKPLALSLEECHEVARTIAQTGVYLMPAFKLRYYPLIRKAQAFIPEPLVIVGQVMDNRWPDDSWIQHPEQGGANVFSQGCHATDIIRFFAGSEPVTLWAVGGAFTHPNHPRIDHCVASIQFGNGCIASWIQGDAAVGQLTSKFFFELFGHGKSVQFSDRFTKATFYDGSKTWVEQRDEEEGCQLENESFVRALIEGRAPELTVRDGIQATRIVLAADQAIRTGKVQSLV